MQHKVMLIARALVLVGVLLLGPSSCHRSGRVVSGQRNGSAATMRTSRTVGSGPVDVSVITRHPDRYHDRMVHVRGVVASICRQEGCFIDIVPLSGRGEGVLVSGRRGPGGYSRDVVGQIAQVKGTFFTKVYPFSRMHHWQHHSWRAGEARIPAFARIYRIWADSVTFSRTPKPVPIRETPLRAYRSPVIPLDRMEFEAARMGTGKKCLAPGKATPDHSTRRYHRLLFVFTGELTIRMKGITSGLRLTAGHACYIPSRTRHAVENRSSKTACYVFVYSLPEKIKPRPTRPRPPTRPHPTRPHPTRPHPGGSHSH